MKVHAFGGERYSPVSVGTLICLRNRVKRLFDISPNTPRSQRKSQLFVFEHKNLNSLALFASLREKTRLDV
jgi:hypothetical protein